MSIITLTSDWGLKDQYLSVVKGCLLTQIPDARIIDITHDIRPYDIISASFVVRHAYTFFPQGTVHILGVNTEATLDSNHVAIEHNGHYFIGTDNGIFSLIFEELPEKIVEIKLLQDSDFFTFSTRDVFVKTAAYILKNKTLDGLGPVKETLNEKELIKPVSLNGILKGNVIYIDRYENVITNISQKVFKEFVNKRPFSINFRGAGYEITKISKSYSDVPLGEKLALFSTTNYLEIAINKGKASSLLGLNVNDNVNVICKT